MKVFYHKSDFDGICSGAIVRHYYGTRQDQLVELCPIDYGDEFPWDTIEPDELVFMCDFTIQPYSDMARLNDMCNLHWIDHHASSISTIKRLGINIPGVRKIGKSGCELTWQYLYKGLPPRIGKMPLSVYLLGRYDVWDHKDKRVLPFQYGMKCRDLSDITPGTQFWYDILANDRHVDGVIEQGKSAMKYMETYITDLFQRNAFELKWEGHNCIVINYPRVSTYSFAGIYDPVKHDLMVSYSFDGTQWRVSLRTEKDIDCSKIAAKYGGGGHDKASGFQIANIRDIFPDHPLEENGS